MLPQTISRSDNILKDIGLHNQHMRSPLQSLLLGRFAKTEPKAGKLVEMPHVVVKIVSTTAYATCGGRQIGKPVEMTHVVAGHHCHMWGGAGNLPSPLLMPYVV
jgi:hypothetical protein